MARKKKQEVKVNSNDSLEGLMQETYNDACLQISEAQKYINEMTFGTTLVDVDDVTKVTREKAGLLKIKDSAIRIKLELTKLQNDVLKNSGDTTAVVNERTGANNSAPSQDDFDKIRQMIKDKANEN